MASNFFINLDIFRGTERYALGKFLDFTDNFDPVTSEFLQRVTQLKIGGTYTVRGEDSRPDTVSQELYGNTQYWWILMFYNGITRIDNITNGLELRYPDSDELEDLYFTLKSKELGR